MSSSWRINSSGISAALLAGAFFLSSGSAMAGFVTGALAGTTGGTATDGSSKITSSPSESSSGESAADKTARQFIFHNYDPLQMDIARGQGEHLQALISIYSCGASSQTALIGAIRQDLVRKQSSGHTMNPSPEIRATQLHQVIDQQIKGDFAQACIA
mgnify:CR=1 FL=1